MADTLDYYQTNREGFLARTATADVSELYKPFLEHLTLGATILDAGCGSGRDSLAFKERGYSVTAFDASPAMVEAATERTGLPVVHSTFADVTWQNEFDAVWACASLLHVPRVELPAILERMALTLKKGGILYCSFKYGTDERLAGTRYFNDQTEQSLTDIVADIDILEPVRIWRAAAAMANEDSSDWANGLVRRV